MKKWFRIGSVVAISIIVALFVLLYVVRSAPNKSEESDNLVLSDVVECIEQVNVTIEDIDSLRIYYPNFSKVDLVCEVMPSPEDESVIMCCEAAFTGELLKEFQHLNIAGNHVSGGTLFKGYKCNDNTGCFAYYADNGTWEFAMNSFSRCLEKAVENNGMAFGQTMVIYNGEDVHNGLPLTDSSVHQYRTLCELNGKLCIIDSKVVMPYGDFIKSLLKVGVTHALYLDMGTGWNYSYYRDNVGNVNFIHNQRIEYTTNWITFYNIAVR